MCFSFYSIHRVSASSTVQKLASNASLLAAPRDRLRAQVFFSVDPLIRTTVLSGRPTFVQICAGSRQEAKIQAIHHVPSYAHYVLPSSAHIHRLIFPTRYSQHSIRCTLMTLAWETGQSIHPLTGNNSLSMVPIIYVDAIGACRPSSIRAEVNRQKDRSPFEWHFKFHFVPFYFGPVPSIHDTPPSSMHQYTNRSYDFTSLCIMCTGLRTYAAVCVVGGCM